MREFPHDRYAVQRCLKKTSLSSTYVVKSLQTAEQQLVLKTYSASSLRSHSSSFETDLAWQHSLAHPHIGHLEDAGITRGGGLFLVRNYESHCLNLIDEGLK